MKQKRKLSRRQAGVTLIEMLVVVTIIALFAALVAPTMLKHGDKARVVAARSQIQNFSTAIGSYKLDTSQYPSYRARPGRSSQSAGRPAKLEWSLPAAGRPERPLGPPLHLQISWRPWRRARYHVARCRWPTGRRRHQRRYRQLAGQISEPAGSHAD